jgi:hypothetical protein
VHVFFIVLGKQTDDFRNYSVFREKRVFRSIFFENFSKNMKLVIKLLCLSKRQPKYQRVETNINIFVQYIQYDNCRHQKGYLLEGKIYGQGSGTKSDPTRPLRSIVQMNTFKVVSIVLYANYTN